MKLLDFEVNISEKQMLDAAYKDRDTRDFYQALKDKADAKQNAIIAKLQRIWVLILFTNLHMIKPIAPAPVVLEV
jgi:hypothetical protein